jgi:hypothetical protein
MQETQRSQLIDAVERWARLHPSPSRPVINSADGHCYTPMDIVKHLRSNTADGRILWKLLENAAAIQDFESVLQMLDKGAAVSHRAMSAATRMAH